MSDEFKVGDIVKLVGKDLSSTWYGKMATIKKVEGRMLTVECGPAKTSLLVFVNEVIKQ